MSKPQQDCTSWLRRVNGVQTNLLTPERREQLQRSVEQSRLAEHSRRKMKSVQNHSFRSKALCREGLRQMQSACHGEDYTAVHDRWSSAQQASEMRQKSCFARIDAQSMDARSALTEMAVYSTHNEEQDEEEGLHEAAALVGASASSHLAAVASGGEAARNVPPEDDFQALLEQLRNEPTADAELAAKFGLYDTYSQQVQNMRETLFGLFEENKPNLPVAVMNDTHQQLKKIDNPQAMGIRDDARGWFVYHMMRQAGTNNDTMSGVMKAFEKKLEFLANATQNECPVCLETFSEQDPAETLGCCHKVCRECWSHWTAVMHGHPFCPLCRNDEFVEVVHARATEAG